MTPPRQRKGSGGPAQAPQVQPRPATPAPRPSPRDDGFPPNPVRGVRAGREEPVDRMYRVTGPKPVGGVSAPGTVVLCLTDAQAAALESGGHIEAVKELDPVEPMAGTDEEGN